MQKIFDQYGGVITAVMAVVALIGVILLLFTGTGSGWMEKGFNNVIGAFTNKTDDAINRVTGGAIRMLEGRDQVYALDSTELLSFRSSAPYSEFQEVRVDNAVVDPSNYTVTEGSTTITFDEAYSKALAVGEHSIEIVSATGEAKAEFTVVEFIESPTTKPAPDIPTATNLTGVWVFNENADFGAMPYDNGGGFGGFVPDPRTYSVDFTSNGIACVRFEVTVSMSTLTDYVGNDGVRCSVQEYYQGVYAWDNEAYRTVDFGETGQTVSDEFYDWLTANATYQGNSD